MFIKEIPFPEVNTTERKKKLIIPKNDLILLDKGDNYNKLTIAHKKDTKTTTTIEFLTEDLAQGFLIECEILYHIWCVRSTRGFHSVTLLTKDYLKLSRSMFEYYKYSKAITN